MIKQYIIYRLKITTAKTLKAIGYKIGYSKLISSKYKIKLIRQLTALTKLLYKKEYKEVERQNRLKELRLK